MSYMRDPFYVWCDSEYMHVWLRSADEQEDEYAADCDFPRGIKVPNAIWDALCLMRVAEIERSGNRKAYERRALKYAGNFGSADLYRRIGHTPPWEATEASA